MKSTTWILIADGARARLFEVTKDDRMQEVAAFANPEGRSHSRELTRGHLPTVNESVGPARHSIEPHTTLRQKSAMRFARELKGHLESAHAKRSFDRLVLAAPPHFLGVLRNTLDQSLLDLVVAEVPHELTALPLAAIREHLPAGIFA